MPHAPLIPTPNGTPEAAPPMTSMIDVVFLLITFFMLVSEFTRQDQIAEIRLPAVAHALPETDPRWNRIVVNITRGGAFYVGGNELTLSQLGHALTVEARMAGGADGAGSPPLRIRADKETPFHHVRSVLAMCAARNIRIWQVSFGARPAGDRDE
ncbi:biopolymer transporter ExbD [bacterium]|nr:biopolymer transporter ExbD [bacterium]